MISLKKIFGITVGFSIVLLQVLKLVEMQYLGDYRFVMNLMSIFLANTCLLFMVYYNKVNVVKVATTFFLILLALFFGSFRMGLHGLEIYGQGFYYTLLILSSILMAYVLIELKWIRYLALPIFICFSLAIILYMKVSGDISLRYFFVGSSFNMVSAVLIYSTALVIVVHKDEFLVPVSVLSICCIFCIILYARASIAISLALILWFLAFKAYKKPGLGIFFLVLFSFICWLYYTEIYNVFVTTKFSVHGLESPRWDMIRDYLTSLNWHSFILGSDLNMVPSIKAYEGNSHNSFIALHSVLGVYSIIFMFFVLIYLIYRCNLFYLGVIFLILVRASTDIIIFPGVLDLFLFLIIFYSISDAVNNKKVLNFD